MKSPAECAVAWSVGVVFYKDAAHPKLSGYFISQENPAGRGANYNLDVGRAKMLSQRVAKSLGMLGPLKHLKLFPVGGAVAARGKLEMALQHGARCAEDLFDFLLA